MAWFGTPTTLCLDTEMDLTRSPRRLALLFLIAVTVGFYSSDVFSTAFRTWETASLFVLGVFGGISIILYFVLRSLAFDRFLIGFQLCCGMTWGVVWGLVGILVFWAGGRWGVDAGLPYFGVQFGLLSGTAFGFACIVRYGGLPPTAILGTATGVAASVFTVVIAVLSLILSNSFSLASYGYFVPELREVVAVVAMGAISGMLSREIGRRVMGASPI